MAALGRINGVVSKVTWAVLAVGLVNHFVYEFLPRHWEAPLLTAIWVLVGLTLAGHLGHWVARRVLDARAGRGAAATD